MIDVIKLTEKFVLEIALAVTIVSIEKDVTKELIGKAGNGNGMEMEPLMRATTTEASAATTVTTAESLDQAVLSRTTTTSSTIVDT